MVIKIGKKTIVTLVSIILIAIIYNFAFFLIPWRIDQSRAAFWISYGLTWAALVLAGITVGVSFAKKGIKSKIFGLPIFNVGICLVIAQFIIDALVVGIGSWTEFAYWVALMMEVLLFCGFGLCVIPHILNRKHIEAIDKQENRESFIKELRIQIESLCKNNTIDELKNDLYKLNESVKYSDPVSNNSIVDIEDQIADKVSLLRNAIEANNADDASKLIKVVCDLVEERKIRAKNSH